MTVFKGVSLRARPVCVFVCVCACMSVLTGAFGPAAFIITGGQEVTNIVLSLLSQPQTPEPSILESPGLEESGIRAVAAGGGGSRARPPAAAPRSCTGMKHELFTRGWVGWMGRAQDVVPMAGKS